MPTNDLALTENYEAKKELLKSYYSDYERLLRDAPELTGKIRFESFLKFSYDFDRQQRLLLRRMDNNRNLD
jgi:hypothetical protein